MKLPKILESIAIGSDNIQAELQKAREIAVAEAKSQWEKEKTLIEKKAEQDVKAAINVAHEEWIRTTTDLVSKSAYAAPGPSRTRSYVTTSHKKGTGKEQAPPKTSEHLWAIFSNAPGSIQSASRIQEAVVGGGYVLEEVEGRKGSKEDLQKLIKFFDSPNPEDTIETLAQKGIESYLAYGNWYMEKVPTKGTANAKNKKVAELYHLDAAQMRIMVDAAKYEKGVEEKVAYKRNVDRSKNIFYDADLVTHIARPDSKAGVYGRAVLETNETILEMLLRALTYNTSVLRNGGRPPLKIELPSDTTEADADAVNRFYEANYMGEANAGKALVLFKGAQANPLGITPQDMSYLDLIMTGIKLVAGQYGVPLPLVGFSEGANRAVMAELRRAFYYTNIYPLRKYISKRITDDIILRGFGIEGWKLSFRKQGLEESEASRRDIMAGMAKGVYAWNEGRAKIGLLPIAEEWANKYYLVGSKNDSMLELAEAIGRVPDQAAPEVPAPSSSVSAGEGADQKPVDNADGNEFEQK